MARSSPAAGASPAEPVERRIGLRMAHLHLRTGSFALARAELESLAGSGGLDDDGLLDLAEIRWRTGDLAGAGEAASAYLATQGDDALGLVIAAEAGAALGRPAEARRLVDQVLEREVPLDPLFAGMPRSGLWPHGAKAVAGGEPAGLLFPGTGDGQPATASTGASPWPDVPSPVLARWPSPPAPIAAGEATEPGLWDSDPGLTPGPPVPDAPAEVEAGRAALARGAHGDAALHLAVALRLDPATAPAVLQAIGDGTGSSLAIVRGDALRVLGQEWDAQRLYASVAARLRERGSGAEPTPSTPSLDPGVPSRKEEA